MASTRLGSSERAAYLRARIIIIAVKSFPLELYNFVAQSRVPKRLYCPIAGIHWASSPYGILIESQLALSKRPNQIFSEALLFADKANWRLCIPAEQLRDVTGVKANGSFHELVEVPRRAVVK